MTQAELERFCDGRIVLIGAERVWLILARRVDIPGFWRHRKIPTCSAKCWCVIFTATLPAARSPLLFPGRHRQGACASRLSTLEVLIVAFLAIGRIRDNSFAFEPMSFAHTTNRIDVELERDFSVIFFVAHR